MKRQMKTEREKLVETKSLLDGATSRCAALIRNEAVLKRTNEDLGIQIRGMRENVKNHKLQTADLQLQLKKLEEENKEHIEEKRYEYDFRSNLENDVEDLKRSISLKDKEIADLKRIIGEQNQSTGKQSDASGEEAFHSDGTADEHSQEDDESEYYGTYSESSNEAHGNPSKKVRTDTIKSHFREVLANKSRDKIGSSTEDKNSGLSAKNISLRSTRTRKLQLVYERYSSRTSRHLIKVSASLIEDYERIRGRSTFGWKHTIKRKGRGEFTYLCKFLDYKSIIPYINNFVLCYRLLRFAPANF
ncbi:hypothetical protein FOZ60_017106 [Perkinsus olseni]|uniref:Uncharacterized protein n=1 Tax=Perkinsus olseni TaxID=32597 RepID=A0A7J6N1Y7_PEROL|nr:hypothetical protein FOZ60_017106 [Perkinsus olseni]